MAEQRGAGSAGATPGVKVENSLGAEAPGKQARAPQGLQQEALLKPAVSQPLGDFV